MSHIESVNTVITDLEALKAACKATGSEFVANKKTYTWFGQSMGDYPLPNGMTKEDLGKCAHAIKVPGVRYEIGVVPLRETKGYTLAYDFYGYGENQRHDGHKLKEKFGAGLTKLVDQYSLAALKRKATSKGLLSSMKMVNGKMHLTVSGF